MARGLDPFCRLHFETVMRAAGIFACMAAICAADCVQAEIVKFSENAATPYAGLEKAADAYVRVALDVEGIADSGAAAPAKAENGLTKKVDRGNYKIRLDMLRPETSRGKGATLLVESESEAGAGADLIEVARQRRASILFIPADCLALGEALCTRALRDLVSLLRKTYGFGHVVVRGSQRNAEFLQRAAARENEDKKSEPTIFDALLLHDRTIAAPAADNAGAPPASNLPFAIETYSSSIFWRDDLKFAARETDLPDGPRQRVFFLAGAAAQSGGPTQNCAAPVNSRSTAPAIRALFVALDEFLSKGTAVPAGRVPQKSNRTLVLARDLHWPKAPALEPPLVGGERFVPAIDPDGNETAGLRLPDQAVAIATFTGWNARKDKAGPPCEAYGALIPFAASKAERERNGDTRLSLQERFGLRDFYVATVRTVADRLVKERLLLKPDADAYVAQAKKAPF